MFRCSREFSNKGTWKAVFHLLVVVVKERVPPITVICLTQCLCDLDLESHRSYMYLCLL